MALSLPSAPVLLGLEAMGTRFELLLGTGEEVRLRAVGEEALAEIARLDRQLSVYRRATYPGLPRARARRPSKSSHGSLHCSNAVRPSRALPRGRSTSPSAPSCGHWASSTAQGVLPATRRAGMPNHVSVGAIYISIRLPAPCISDGPTCGSILAVGKGYAVDAAIEILRGHGITSALLHGGTSSIHALGAPPDETAWHIAWKPPAGVPRTFDLRDSALSVSAVHGKTFESQGRVYGHVMDPRSGTPTTAARAVAVWGNASLECDALSTALLVLGVEWLDAFGRRFPHFEAVVV